MLVPHIGGKETEMTRSRMRAVGRRLSGSDDPLPPASLWPCLLFEELIHSLRHEAGGREGAG